MSSLLSAISRRAPKAVGLMGSTRARSLRVLAAGPHSGLSRPSKDASAAPPLSALAPGAASATGSFRLEQQQQQQQRRLLSVQSDENQEVAEEVAGGAVEEAVEEAAEEVAEEAAEEVAEEPAPPTSSEPLFLVQLDGLPFTMPQEEIEQWLTDAGCPAARVTVPLWSERSMRAGQNKGKAYLHYSSEEETQAVLDLSGRAIGERWISISRLAIPLEETSTVTIKGLQGFPREHVMSIFEEAVGAAPVEVNIIENPNRTRGLAFVKFETPELAREALTLDGSNIENQWVDVSLHVAKVNSNEGRIGLGSRRPFSPDVPDELVVVLKGLPFSLLEDEIKAFLVNHNIDEDDIVAMEVPKYNQTQFNTGLAMFHMKSAQAVEDAVALKGTYIGDRWVDVSRWNERGQGNNQSTNKSAIEGMRARVPAALRAKHPSLPVVVISGLPFHKTQEEVIEFLESNGIPRTAMLEVDMPNFLNTERNTGSCWLVMDDEQAYGNLMDLNGAVLDERWLTVNDA